MEVLNGSTLYSLALASESVEDGQPFEMGPKEVKHMQKVAMSVHAPEGLDRLGLNPNSTVKHLGFTFLLVAFTGFEFHQP